MAYSHWSLTDPSITDAWCDFALQLNLINSSEEFIETRGDAVQFIVCRRFLFNYSNRSESVNFHCVADALIIDTFTNFPEAPQLAAVADQSARNPHGSRRGSRCALQSRTRPSVGDNWREATPRGRN
jgi:hypothetical protein